MKEYQLQISLKKFLDYLPNVLWTASVAGAKLDIRTAAKIKAMGYKRGCPDVMIFEPRGGYYGLFVEMKKKGGRLTEEQKWFLEELNKRGYKAVVCYSLDEAIKEIKEYLSL